MPRSLRSGNSYASPPPPPPRPARIPPDNVIRNRDYELLPGGMNIPMGLARKKVAQCHLEFIDMGPVDPEYPPDEYRNNHCILRLTFLHQLQDDTPYAPIGTRGVILDLEGVDQYETTFSGELMMSTFRYEGRHQRWLHVAPLRMGGQRTVGDCVRIIRDSRLVPCRFDASNENLAGCRDFMFNYKYNEAENPPDNRVLNPVSYAVFERTYQHTTINGINYTGTRRFLEE
ncbi:hypothetical protein PEX1_084720 [Penicillium expansum]|uniref:Uncharacterized protein n=1 Tax=Penicillium expansum TaxID=27334 RepID=A0A0A2KJ83_PENEN|nr:hypothetical protein PEX2_018980 [Penicillium expansum]KGO41489.1 hypothetical protein PEXP_105630 [Penicillium expansum]KGO62491.1 hypothetical protein PEX2_018980 [Penicillium expansum]KGO67013.1 hypothetical protein PEX1_084720 [Penicillium expansum]